MNYHYSQSTAVTPSRQWLVPSHTYHEQPWTQSVPPYPTQTWNQYPGVGQIYLPPPPLGYLGQAFHFGRQIAEIMYSRYHMYNQYQHLPPMTSTPHSLQSTSNFLGMRLDPEGLRAIEEMNRNVQTASRSFQSFTEAAHAIAGSDTVLYQFSDSQLPNQAIRNVAVGPHDSVWTLNVSAAPSDCSISKRARKRRRRRERAKERKRQAESLPIINPTSTRAGRTPEKPSHIHISVRDFTLGNKTCDTKIKLEEAPLPWDLDAAVDIDYPRTIKQEGSQSAGLSGTAIDRERIIDNVPDTQVFDRESPELGSSMSEYKLEVKEDSSSVRGYAATQVEVTAKQRKRARCNDEQDFPLLKKAKV
ncbi:MAG: hypothetical protein L6R40_004575 [Gallowayella cf. fulva]|nr:MAG: hypothetical protein L6R40_004575 [Xanthomendoza cf. fulva]